VVAFLLAACGESDKPAADGADAGTVPDAGPGDTDRADAAVVDDACDPSTCTGCCMDGVCVDGTSPDACGTGGAACSACAPSEVCSGVCILDPSLRYDMVLLDADIDSTKVSGASWDINGGLPDVRFYGWTAWVDSIDSSVRSDSTSPDWMGEVVAEQGNFNAGFVGFVFDDDGIDDDFICELVNCPVSPPNTTLECSVERGTESPSEYDGPNAGCTLRYRIVPH
jgi:hypothetical protein